MGIIVAGIVYVGFAILCVYAFVASLLQGESLIESFGDALWFLPVIIPPVIFSLLSMLGKKSKKQIDNRMENSPAVQSLLKHISSESTAAVIIGLEEIKVYSFDFSLSHSFNYANQGLELDKNEMSTLAHYIGRQCFKGNYYVSDLYEKDFVPGSGDIIGFSPNEVGGYKAKVDYGDDITVFKGIGVANKKFEKTKKKATPPKDTRKKMF